ncbi:MAG: HD-GYP domain-containing protein [Dehalococcoidia bacterium]|nr:HD-GYP domain-containing protein [Dehalococcoidia bacterium]
MDELTYLGNFIVDADVFWQAGVSGKLNSGIWNEVSRSGIPCQFEASALNLKNRRILIIQRIGLGLTERQVKEQKIKENLLAFEDLSRIEEDLERYNFLLEAQVEKRTIDLRERIKELNCLFSISNLIQDKGLEVNDIYRGIIDLVQTGWQFPEITCARLTVDGVEYATQNWLETSWKQKSLIHVQDEETGFLEVCYLEQRPIQDEGPFLREERKLIDTICELLGRAIHRIRAVEDLAHSYLVLSKTFEDTIVAMGNIVETKDPYTWGHQIRVACLASEIAKEMNLPDETVRTINIAAKLHDIGKIYVPADILSRPGRLGALEFEIIKKHAQQGYDILSGIEFPWPIANIVLQHHERLDGSGYPAKLKEPQILREAKILAVADVVEAMSTDRPYRMALGLEKALQEISMKKGIAYDNEVVDSCIKLFKEKGFTFEH